MSPPAPATPPSPQLLASFPPGLSPRPEQKRILADIGEALASGYRDIILCAPTGVGKSAVAAAVARSMGSSFVLTAQKILQDQYSRDFGSWLAPGKGKGNFPCRALYEGVMSRDEAAADPSVSCANGVCSWHTPQGTAHCEYKPVLAEFEPGGECGDDDNCCHYYSAKYTALASPHSVYNYAAYFAIRGQFLPDRLIRRQVVICDEAHELEDVLAEHVGCEITRSYLADADSAFSEFEDVDAVEGVTRMVSLLCDRYGERLRSSPDGRMQSRLERLSLCRYELANSPGNVSVQVNRYDDGHVRSVSVRPLSVSRYAERYLDSPHRIFMSATIHPDMFCGRMGIDGRDCCFVDVKTAPFEASRAPVSFCDVAAINRDTGEDEYALLYDRIDSILDMHGNHKGLILVSSVDQCRSIAAGLSERNRGRLLQVYNSAPLERDETLRLHAGSPEPTVLISPSLWYGVDLRGMLSRFCIIAKCPFPSLVDRRVGALAKASPVWYRYHTLCKMLQGMGRSIRSEDDWADTYVLDSNAGKLVRQMSAYVPDAYGEALSEVGGR